MSDICYPRKFHEMRQTLKRTVAPTIEPVQVDGQMRSQCRVDTTEEDDLISEFISASREIFETDTQRGLLPQTWTLELDAFPNDVIELRVCPVTSVTSITYLDSAGDSQTLATTVYSVSTSNEPARITLKYGQSWPTTYDQANAVTVTFVVGYTVNTVPALAKQAIRLLAAEWFKSREATEAGSSPPIVYGYDAIVDRLRWSGYR